MYIYIYISARFKNNIVIYMIYNDLYCQFIVLLLIFRCNLAISYIAYVSKSIKDINISRLNTCV